MKTNKYILTLAIVLCCAVGNLHAVDKSYYNSLNGKSGTTLREAMTALVYDKHTTGLGYNWVFDGIDWDSNGNVYDIYSDCGHTKNDATDSYKCCCDAINREHIVPQSTFGSMYPQYADRHHLFVVDGKANGYRSDFAFGECSGGTKGTCKSSSTVKPSEGTATCTNHEYGKLGTSTFSEVSISDKVYEPKDEYKGDIARAIMYMVIRYATADYCKVKSGSGTSANSYPVTAWSGSSNVGLMFSNNLSTNYGLSNYGKALLMKWHRADPVSAKEIARNSGVEVKQGNRNPFIDLPDLAEYLWGTHAGESFPLSSLDIATGSGGGGSSSYQITLNRHGVTQTITCTGEYTLPTSSTEVAACTGWAFAGWSASSPVNTTTAPTFKNSVTSSDADKTFYAVYSHTTTPALVRKAKMAESKSTLNFTAACGGSGTADDGAAWTVTSDGSESNFDNTSGIHYGTNSASVRYVQLSTSDISGTITQVVVNCRDARATATVSVTVGGTTFTCSGSATATNSSANYTFTNAGASGEVVVRVDRGSSTTKAIYVKSVEVTYTAGSSPSTTYKTSPDCGTAHTITLNNGGSATGGDFFADVTSAYSGATVTLTAAPDDGYAFSSWTVTNASTSAAITVTNNQFTMPDANVNVSATFTKNPEHTITFYINDKQVSQQTLSEGLEAEAPNVPACEGYTFVGWYPSSLATTNTTEYDWISNITVGNGNESFYAIYSKTETSGSGTPVPATLEASYSSHEGWTISGTGGTSYWILKSGASITSPTIADLSTVTSITFTARTYGGAAYKTVNVATSGNTSVGSADAGSTSMVSKTINVSGLTGSGSLVFSSSTTTSSNGPGINNIVINYTTGGGSSTTYYTSATGCDATADCTGKLATPNVTATGSDGKITLSWPAITGATDYEVTIGAGAGYTTECGSAAVIGSITGTTAKTCVITGLTNGLAYTTNVVAKASSSTCDSDADEDTATPQDCTPWDDPTLSWNQYSLNTTTNKTATVSVGTPTYGTLSFESSNPEVLTVNSSKGAVTAAGAGEATVTAHWTAADGFCEKTMTSSTFEVAGPLTISFDANADGVTGSMTDQTVTYKVSTAIKDNAFRREGYTFIGWATSADGEKVYNDKQSVAFTNSQTLYAKWQLNSRNVTFTPSPSGATVTVNGKSTSPQAVNYGETVTVHIAPANHYTITTVSIKGATSGNDIAQTGSGETRTFTMPDENVTVSVTMTPESTYTATFYNSGVAYGVAQTGYADDDINAPATNPVSCDADEFTFVGWVAAEQTSETTTKPEVLTFPQTMPVGNVNYYALYRRVEGSGGGEATVTFLTASSDGNTAYTEDDEIKENLVESYSGISSFAGSKAYIGKSGVKLGASGGSGYITLNLSSPITTNTITVSAAKYGTDTGNLQIEVNGSTSFGDEQSPADGTLTFTNASDVEISDLTISTTIKRAYVASISLGGGGTSYYTTSPVCTPCDYHVTLTKGAETNGTFTLSKTNGTYDNCKTNFAVTVSNIVPATGYYCSGVSATGGSHVIVSEPDANGNYTVSFPKGNTVTSTVTAVFEEIPSHTVTWSANGNTTNQVSYKEGATITFPESATGCDGMTFMGWSAVEVEEQDNAPAYTTSATMGTEDITFYAVFATASSGGGGALETLLSENFSSITNGNNTSTNGSSNSWSGNDNIEYVTTVYQAGGAVRLGGSSATGSIETKELSVVAGKEITVSFDVKGWSSVEGNIKVTVTGCTAQTITYTQTMSGSFETKTATFTLTSDNPTVTIATTAKRAFIDNVIVTTGGGGSTTYSGYTTSCTPCDKQVNIVKGTAEHGSFELSITGSQDNCHSAGLVVTVTSITPDANYQFKEITQTSIVSGVTIDNDAKTVIYAKDVTGTSTINVVFEPKPTYTVLFLDNGVEIFRQEVVEGKTFTKPSDPEGCEEYSFLGWWAAELAPENTNAYSWLNSFGAVYSNQTYYAVYEHSVTSGGGGVSNEFSLYSGALTEGDYLIVYDNGAMNTTVSSDRLQYEVVTPTNDVITTTDATIIWHIAPSGDYWTIYNADAEKYAAGTGAKNKAQMLADGTDNKSLWTVSGTSTYEFVNKANTANSVNANLRKNDTYGYACYATATGGALSLYKNASSGSTTKYYTTDTDCRDCSIPTLSFAAATVNKFDGDAPFINALTVSGNTMGATVSYTSSNPSKAEVSADGTVTILDAMSTEPVIITATLAKADDGVNCQKKVSASYTLNIYNKVTWLVNGTPCADGSQTTQTTEGGTIVTAPIEPDGSDVCFGKTFVGWTTAEFEEDDTKPEILYTSSSIVGLHITESTTFYAVFAELTGTLNQYRKGTPTQLTTGQKVIIVNTAANKAMKAANSFKNGYDVTPVGDAFVTEEQTIIWTVEQVDGGGYYFMYGDKYLNASGSSLYLDGDEDAWTVTGASPYIITSGKYPSYSLEWYSGEFKSFTTGSGDAFNMDLYFPNWTIGAYATTCGLCMPKPEVTSTIIKSDRVTITWKAVVNATGYEFTCSGGEVSVSGTTATITGLTPLSDYTYSIRAQGGAPYTCFRTTNGSFSTPDCDDMPYDITATPYNVVQAIIRWKAEAERGKVVVYNDEACTQTRVTIADTISPCYVSGLEENTRYWFKVFGGVSQDCESPVQTFLTQTTAVEIVEWQNNGVIILLTGDETTASVLIEDKQEHIENAGNVADKLFISKYFEADGNNKMIAVYNGTKETIDITNYWLKHSNKGSAETKICLKKFGKTPGQIAPNEEIIIMRFTSSTDPATECAEKEENYDEWNIVEDKEMDGEGNNIYNWLANIAGPQSVGLYNGTTMIDLIGARTEGGALVQIQSSIKEPCSAAIGAKNDAGGFSARGLERGSGDSITLSTNRCLLIRKNTVKSGDNAVATNIYSSQEECSSEITKAFKTLSDEWVGYVIGKDNASTRTCEGLAEVGGFDYQGYYASYDTAVVVQDLVQNADGTITIPIPKLDTMSCTMLRINVYDKNTKEQKASREYRIPIMVQSGEVKSTNELFTKHGVAVCKECDVLVFNGATLKKDNEGTDRDSIGNLTLYPGSTLELPSGKGDYHVKSLAYRVEGDNVPVTKLNADLYSETQRLVVTRRIKNDRYYFISFPYDVNVNEITLANDAKAVNGKDFRLMEYDADARAAEGSLQGAPGHWKLFTGDKLTAGQGYAIAVNTKAMKEIMFPMTIPSKNLTYEERTKQTNTVDINEYTGAARNTNYNWNLIAHPYITKFEVTSATSVEAYWENPSRQDSAWVDDWTTWPEEDPTQPTDTTHAQNPDSTETHIGDILESGTVDNGLVWVLYANATMELTGGGQMVDFSSLEAVPWAQHRQFIKDLKIGGDVQKIGKYAFSQCTNLVTVTIAAPVTNLASYAFAGCTQLRSFRIESTQYISATTTTFDGVSTLSVYVPQSMYDQYSQNTPWNKMALSAFDGSSTTGGDGSNTNPTPRRVAEHPEGWTESAGGIYVTVPIVVDGKVDYEQHWINDVDDIKPFTAVFIQGDGKGQMTFNMYPATPAPKRMWQADRYETRDHTVFVGLTINGNGHKDMTSLRLRPDFTEDYKLNLDLLKFTTFYTSRPQIYFKTPNDQLAFRAVSDSLAANTWLPVGVYCRDAGEYTFALYDRYVWDEVEAVYLRDNVTGAETNLLMGNYTITTTGQIYTNTRFAVKVLLRRKVKDTPTMIDHTEDPNAPRKFFRDGLLYIMRDGKVYDLTGKPVQFDDLLNR